VFPDPGKPVDYPAEIHHLTQKAIKTAMEQCHHNAPAAVAWIEDDVDTYLHEWADETHPENVDYRATLLTASWLAVAVFDFYDVAYDVKKAAAKIGPDTEGEVRTLVEDLQKTAERTCDWPLSAEILRKWLAPLCDE
jgi:hypothetical protein